MDARHPGVGLRHSACTRILWAGQPPSCSACCAQAALHQQLQHLNPDELGRNGLLPYVLWSDGTALSSSFRVTELHPVCIALIYNTPGTGRRKYAMRRIGMLPTFAKAGLGARGFTKEVLESTECALAILGQRKLLARCMGCCRLDD